MKNLLNKLKDKYNIHLDENKINQNTGDNNIKISTREQLRNNDVEGLFTDIEYNFILPKDLRDPDKRYEFFKDIASHLTRDELNFNGEYLQGADIAAVTQVILENVFRLEGKQFNYKATNHALRERLLKRVLSDEIDKILKDKLSGRINDDVLNKIIDYVSKGQIIGQKSHDISSSNRINIIRNALLSEMRLNRNEVDEKSREISRDIFNIYRLIENRGLEKKFREAMDEIKNKREELATAIVVESLKIIYNMEKTAIEKNKKNIQRQIENAKKKGKNTNNINRTPASFNEKDGLTKSERGYPYGILIKLPNEEYALAVYRKQKVGDNEFEHVLKTILTKSDFNESGLSINEIVINGKYVDLDDEAKDFIDALNVIRENLYGNRIQLSEVHNSRSIVYENEDYLLAA